MEVDCLRQARGKGSQAVHSNLRQRPIAWMRMTPTVNPRLQQVQPLQSPNLCLPPRSQRQQRLLLSACLEANRKNRAYLAWQPRNHSEHVPVQQLRPTTGRLSVERRLSRSTGFLSPMTVTSHLDHPSAYPHLRLAESYECRMDRLARHHLTELINESTVVISTTCLLARQSRDLKVSNPA